MWNWPNGNGAAIQAVAAVAVVLLTATLAGITFWYARITSAAVHIAKEQSDRLQRIYVEFGLTLRDGELAIWVANLGACTILISNMRVRRIEKRDPESFKINSVVEAGTSRWIDIPRDFSATYTRRSIEALDLSLDCISSGEQRTTKWRAFTLHKASSGRVVQTLAGIKDIWSLECPRCHRHEMMCMNTDQLNDFDEAFAREKIAVQEIASSCPDHRSQFFIGSKP